jgi:hypothetical protein
MLQELLTYVIEFVAIGGFGGILAHHITQNCIPCPVAQSSSQTASAPIAPTATVESAPAETMSVESTPAIVKPQETPQLEEPSIADPWELPILTSTRRWSTHQPIKPVLALCPAVDSVPVPVSTLDQTVRKEEENDTTGSTDLRKLDSMKLRKLCTQNGIVWRNARGKGKHLTKDMMIVQLEDLAVVA